MNINATLIGQSIASPSCDVLHEVCVGRLWLLLFRIANVKSQMAQMLPKSQNRPSNLASIRREQELIAAKSKSRFFIDQANKSANQND